MGIGGERAERVGSQRWYIEVGKVLLHMDEKRGACCFSLETVWRVRCVHIDFELFGNEDNLHSC